MDLTENIVSYQVLIITKSGQPHVKITITVTEISGAIEVGGFSTQPASDSRLVKKREISFVYGPYLL